MKSDSLPYSRREAIARLTLGATGILGLSTASSMAAEATLAAGPHVAIRGIYGGFPSALLEQGKAPADYGVSAIWVGSDGLKQDDIDRVHKLGLKVFAEL